MGLSRKRRSEVYGAIHQEITNLRLQLIREGHHDIHAKADVVIAQQETIIFRAVLKALGEDADG